MSKSLRSDPGGTNAVMQLSPAGDEFRARGEHYAQKMGAALSAAEAEGQRRSFSGAAAVRDGAR